MINCLTPAIIRSNVRNKFHEDWSINVTCRVFTRKTAPPLAAMKTALPPGFHEDWTLNVTLRVSSRKTPPPLAAMFFQRTGTNFKLSLAIIRTNVFIKFHEDWTINVTHDMLNQSTESTGLV
ncbi:hypothetical protein DPMN_124808 [Dreissena polymorpha]|uniref:Uncharacterized protein n=1 Tax=Dreissena polymorpha TaxID=45954 RepID=A0A9D4GU35_DREPO|nr:hypothetical protein DPMN_124808 [Dreissena polymorpha]